MAFNINDFLNVESKKDVNEDFKITKISVYKLRPSKDNFYSLEDEEVKKIARTIELVGLQQNIVVKAIEGTGEYELIAGHKRRLAILKLLEEGKAEFELVPCKIEKSGSSIENELKLIFTNSTQRDRTDYEKMRETQRVKELLDEYQKDHTLPDVKNKIIASIIGTNKTKIGTLEHINHNLITLFVNEWKIGLISTDTANELAGLTESHQRTMYEDYKTTGLLTAKEVKEVKADIAEKDSEDIKEHESYTYIENNATYPKSEEEKVQARYNAEQSKIDKETKERFEQIKDREKMKFLPQKKVHILKLGTEFFDDVVSGRKTFELRKNDRDYKVGELLALNEYKEGQITGKSTIAKIIYMIEEFTGLADGYCILGIELKTECEV